MNLKTLIAKLFQCQHPAASLAVKRKESRHASIHPEFTITTYYLICRKCGEDVIIEYIGGKNPTTFLPKVPICQLECKDSSGKETCEARYKSGFSKYICSRHKGHSGPHSSCGIDKHDMKVWEQKGRKNTPVCELECKDLDRDTCGALDAQNSYSCSRNAGHEGPHSACDDVTHDIKVWR